MVSLNGQKKSRWIFQSDRLGFRTWRESDREPFYLMNSDPEVMRYFPKPLTRHESDELFKKIQDEFSKNGYGLYAVDEITTGEWLGFIGLKEATFETSFTPCIEIAWRLKKNAQGKGYATEGAKRVLQHAFDDLTLNEVYSFTAKVNTPSEKVMIKVGMNKIGEFDHPLVEEGELRRHLLYRAENVAIKMY